MPWPSERGGGGQTGVSAAGSGCITDGFTRITDGFTRITDGEKGFLLDRAGVVPRSQGPTPRGDGQRENACASLAAKEKRPRHGSTTGQCRASQPQDSPSVLPASGLVPERRAGSS